MSKSSSRPANQTVKNGTLSLLVYDNDEEYRKLIRTILGHSSGLTIDITEAKNDRQMETALKRHTPDVVILDLNLKGKSGMEWLQDIKNQDIAPVVTITGHGDEQIAVEAMKNGAYDYLPKADLTSVQLTRSLTSAREKWKSLKEREQLQAELIRMAMYDTLTNLLSRRALLEQAEVERQRTMRYGRHLSLLMIDIDHFKKVNDTYGHIVGDSVLREIAQALKKHTRRSDFVGRYGGEEFLIILPETRLERALVLAEKLRGQVADLAISTNGKVVKGVTVSIGVSEYDNDPNIDEFINRSDKWLYAAKKNGRNQVQPQSRSKH
ncbi:diguanylate cyclase [Candidatus Neomarinimicrobiota bacterium]